MSDKQKLLNLIKLLVSRALVVTTLLVNLNLSLLKQPTVDFAAILANTFDKMFRCEFSSRKSADTNNLCNKSEVFFSLLGSYFIQEGRPKLDVSKFRCNEAQR